MTQQVPGSPDYRNLDPAIKFAGYVIAGLGTIAIIGGFVAAHDKPSDAQAYVKPEPVSISPAPTDHFELAPQANSTINLPEKLANIDISKVPETWYIGVSSAGYLSAVTGITYAIRRRRQQERLKVLERLVDIESIYQEQEEYEEAHKFLTIVRSNGLHKLIK